MPSCLISLYVYLDKVYLAKSHWRKFKTNTMKRILFFLALLVTTISSAYAQTETKPGILLNGLYIAKTGSVPAANIEIFTYLLFYDDGTVYLQAVSSNDPQSVSKWFGRGKKFSQKGTYKIDGKNITIHVDNKDSEDSKLEGFVETNYKGTIKQNNQICLLRDEEKEEKCFDFAKTP